MMEQSVKQQEEYYRKNLAEMADQHAQELKIMTDRVQQTETRYMEVQKQQTEELNNLRKENLELKTKSGGSTAASGGGDGKALMAAQMENNTLQSKIKDLQSEKLLLAERLKV